MKLWLLIAVFFPLAIFGATVNSLEKDQQDIISLNKSLSIFAEFSPNPSSYNSHVILTIYGRIVEGFHLYSIFSQGDFAPEPTRLMLESRILSRSGSLQESKPRTIIDDAFNLPLKVHKDEFWLKQKYLVVKDVKQGFHKIGGYIQYQVCNNRICSLPLKVYFQEKLQIK